MIVTFCMLLPSLVVATWLGLPVAIVDFLSLVSFRCRRESFGRLGIDEGGTGHGAKDWVNRRTRPLAG